MNTLNEAQWAYLAGFIDGDGTVNVKTKEDGYNWRSVFTVITQKDPIVLEHFRDLLGCGYIYQLKDHKNSFSIEGEAAHLLKFSTAQSIYMAQRLLPYIRLKYKHALKMSNLSPTIPDKTIQPEQFRLLFAEDEKQSLFWAYFAGLIDSDGTIGIYDGTFKRPDGEMADYNVPRVQVAQIHKGFLISLRQEIGYGSVAGNGINSEGNPRWCLCFGSKQSRIICKHVFPYLRIKKDRAEAVLAWKRKQPRHLAELQPETHEGIALFEQGYNINEIADMLDMKAATIRYRLKKLGYSRSLSEAQKIRRQKEEEKRLPRPPKPKKVSLKDRLDVKRAIELRERSFSYEKIAEIISQEFDKKYNHSHIGYWFQRLGLVEVNDDPEEIKEIKRLYVNKQMSLRQVAKEVGRSLSFVQRRIRDAGLTRRFSETNR